MSTPSVPTIDVAPFLTGDGEARRRAAEQIGAACADIGFLTIVGHGVPAALIDEMTSVSRRFFDLPLADKLRAPVNATGSGYVAMQAEALAASRGPVVGV